ncbi:MAG: M23 family metallopeptidase [Bariatricus sp.]|nr:M23 family metallopeptidase [Bariatricus sp.]
MNKKQQLSPKGKKQAALALAICFSAVIAITGAYTWNNYKEKTARELELAREEEQAEEMAEAANATDGVEAEQEENTDTGINDSENENPEDSAEDQNTGVTAETSGSTSRISFSESDQLLWPVDGNVMMSYSMDKTVYFQTLDQYKYNPAMIIAGAVNDNVIAAAPGVVKSIDVLPQTGTTVTVDMGNGYECIYGQLKEVPVRVGDQVEAKTVLGYLSEPTKYYSLEGCNLYFEMRKDGQPVDPLDYMDLED